MQLGDVQADGSRTEGVGTSVLQITSIACTAALVCAGNAKRCTSRSILRDGICLLYVELMVIGKCFCCLKYLFL